MAVTPLLDSDDPVLAHVLRLAGLSVSTTDPLLLDCGEGVTVEDAKAACYMAREETMETEAVFDGVYVRSNEDGWAMDTEIRESPDVDPPYVVDDATSQAHFGFWTLTEDPVTIPTRVYLRGFNYDMYASAAALCDMLAEKMKMQFDFNDGSGSYPRSQKYQQTKQCARDLWQKARPRTVDLNRDDTPGGTFWQEVEEEFADYRPTWAQ